jgi:hypothetical protein
MKRIFSQCLTKCLSNHIIRLVTLILLGYCVYQIIVIINLNLKLEDFQNLETRKVEEKGGVDRMEKMIDPLVKSKFEWIYNNYFWGNASEGSGHGSSIEYTRNCRQILIDVILEYSIKSMLDAPCGSFLWMPLMLRNVSAKLAAEKGIRFKYHGVDVVEKVINESKARYANETRDWEFSVCDFSQQDLPNGYELIFSRDALQHLSYEKVKIFFLIRDLVIYLWFNYFFFRN